MGKPQHVVITYTNHAGETETRLVRPINIHFSVSPYHDSGEQEWLMEAFCEERNAGRTFAMKDVSEWREANDEDLTRLTAMVAERAAAAEALNNPPVPEGVSDTELTGTDEEE